MIRLNQDRFILENTEVIRFVRVVGENGNEFVGVKGTCGSDC